MKAFATLFTELDSTTSTSAKVQALVRYFAHVPAQDAAWAVYFLAGGKPRQVVKTATLRHVAMELAALPEWLFEASYQAVGDLAETIAHVLPAASATSALGLSEWVEDRLLQLRGLPEAEVLHRVKSYWGELDPQGRFLLTKLVGGGFRVGVSRLLVQRALAVHGGLDAKQVAQRMMGYTDARHLPSASAFAALVAAHVPGDTRTDMGQPYPFFLAHALDVPEPPGMAAPSPDWLDMLSQRLGPVTDWQVEWKYDGIRGQAVKRAGQVWLWSRGEELVTERFPELVALMAGLPDGSVLDGEILAWREGKPAPFSLLQQRIGRKSLSAKVLADAPVNFVAYDLLEWQSEDVRALPQAQRRKLLEAALASTRIELSPVEELASWPDYAALRTSSRERGMEGFMLKRRDAAYGTGRSKAEGLWWKWKIEPLSVDCVLVYAQAGHGRRASLYTDYTFAVWNRPPQDAAEAHAALQAMAGREPTAPGLASDTAINTAAPSPQPQETLALFPLPPLLDKSPRQAAPDVPPLQLLPFAKAYSGLSDAEFKQVDAEIRRNTLDKFGPVRRVRPTLVFELGFEGISLSGRHKSGVAVRFPRMLRLRPDKPLHEAASLAELRGLMNL